MRIAVGGFMHETNTFVPTPTTWDDFVRAGPWPTLTEGEAIRSVFHAGLNVGIAHFMDKAETAGHAIVPLAWAAAQPAGRVTDDAFERMAAKLISGLEREKPDAVYLELHGAMVTQSHDDGEGELLRRVRAAVGPATPVLVSLDLHANVSPQMVASADFISSYRTYPHVAWGSAGGLYRCLRQIERESGVHLSLNMGFPPADICDVGPSVTAYGKTQAEVDAAAAALLSALLAAEPEFSAHRPLPVAEAVAEAMRIAASASRPVVLSDTQDNPGAGAPSCTTGLIAELLRQGAERAVVGIMHDPAAAEAAHRGGAGAVLGSLGGGGIGPGQEPLPGPWRIAALSDGR